MPDDSDTVVLASFNRRYEAEIAQGYLHDAGIECVIAADDAGGTDLGLRLTRTAKVIVRTGDEPRARQVLENANVL